jgi:hypothetical protein
MPEHEPQDIANEDAKDTRHTKLDTPRGASTNQSSHEAAAASEPMDLQRLPDAKTPPGRQRTGDPPATKG